MIQLDPQGRIVLPPFCVQCFDNPTQSLVFLYHENDLYELCNANSIEIYSMKLCSSTVIQNKKHRITIPRAIRQGYSDFVILYSKDNRVFIQFHKV